MGHNLSFNRNMPLLIASFAFGFFSILYVLGVALCVWQERELSLPHEKALQMSIFITILSLLLFALALFAFSQVDWSNLFVFAL